MKRRLVVVGSCLRGSGYPNATGTLSALASTSRWEICDRAHWLPEDLHLWRIARGPKIRLLLFLLWLLFRSGFSLLDAIRRYGRESLYYAPYPSLFVLLWASLLPSWWRPKIVSDAYISIWDSMFVDRGSGIRSLAARFAHCVEKRTLKTASAVLVDTEVNRSWVIEKFRTESKKVIALPLALDATPFLSIPPKVRENGRMNVLFVGTLIPLHGISVIADAVRIVGNSAGIEFTFIGDGQQANILEELDAETDRAPIHWIRNWASTEELVVAHESADVTLGVFGGPGKASRVLPFKAYIALASGRAMISQNIYSAPDPDFPPPILGVDANAQELADAILRLRDDTDLQQQLGTAARQYFLQHLSTSKIAACWDAIGTA